MNQTDLRLLILDVLRHVQALGGREWSGLNADACPIGALEGFDSYTGLEATQIIEERLGRPLELDTAFVDRAGKRALTLDQIVDYVAKALGGEGASL